MKSLQLPNIVIGCETCGYLVRDDCQFQIVSILAILAHDFWNLYRFLIQCQSEDSRGHWKSCGSPMIMTIEPRMVHVVRNLFLTHVFLVFVFTYAPTHLYLSNSENLVHEHPSKNLLNNVTIYNCASHVSGATTTECCTSNRRVVGVLHVTIYNCASHVSGATTMECCTSNRRVVGVLHIPPQSRHTSRLLNSPELPR